MKTATNIVLFIIGAGLVGYGIDVSQKTWALMGIAFIFGGLTMATFLQIYEEDK